MISAFRLAEERGATLEPHDFELWVEPTEDDVRRERGTAAYVDVHGVVPRPGTTPFRGRAYLDFLYGEIWTRERNLTRRDRRIISICCCGVAGIDEETSEHLRAALASGDLRQDELEELVVHYAVYLGWPLGRRLDDLLAETATTAQNTSGLTPT